MSRRIVLVDDDSIDRHAILRLLGPEYAVVQAATGAEALEANRVFQPDCVLVDYRLPDIDGVDLARRLALSGVAIVMLTGGGDETVAVEAMKAGVSDYVLKNGLDSTRLSRAVESACERSLLERKLAATRKELEDFAAIAAHDLKSPLATIVGFLRVVSEAPDTSLGKREQPFLERSINLAEGLIDMIDQLSRYTMLGRDSTGFATVDLAAVAKTAVARLADAITRSEGVVHVDELPRVHGVESDLIQLMQNLISNALKYSDKKPVIRISADSPDGQEFRIAVEDNGSGIAEESREAVFEPLKRLNADSGIAGYGLGLAACRKIVLHHGGRIGVEEADGGGCLVRFSLRSPIEPR